MAKTNHLEVEERRGYQWPASALTGHEMEILAGWRKRTKVPICELLRQAISKLDIIINQVDKYGL